MIDCLNCRNKGQNIHYTPDKKYLVCETDNHQTPYHGYGKEKTYPMDLMNTIPDLMNNCPKKK